MFSFLLRPGRHWQFWLPDVLLTDVEDVVGHLSSKGYVKVASGFIDLDNPTDVVDDTAMFAYVGVHTADLLAIQLE